MRAYGTAEMVTISRAEYDALMELKNQNEWLMEQLRLLKKKQFGSSSERTAEQLDGTEIKFQHTDWENRPNKLWR